jgi:uncharacterized protein YgbK (DUF1537 family)
VAFRYGLRATVQTTFELGSEADVVVVDTDTRLRDAAQAARRIGELAEQCRNLSGVQVFKKVDSVLRGHVLDELTALLATCGAQRGVLIPANPSRERIIREGRYYIHGQPLDRTEFARDPHDPATTAEIGALLRARSGLDEAKHWPIRVARAGEPLPTKGILVGEATCANDLAAWCEALDDNTIPAGAAEFFAATLQAAGHAPTAANADDLAADRMTLFVSGSASVASHQFCARQQTRGMPVQRLPIGLFEATRTAPELVRSWVEATVRALSSHPTVTMAIDRPLRQAPGLPDKLCGYLTQAVQQVVEEKRIDHILVEGGATASALLRRLGWHHMHVVDEPAPGTVSLENAARPGLRVTMKPGSYPWPDEVKGFTG